MSSTTAQAKAFNQVMAAAQEIRGPRAEGAHYLTHVDYVERLASTLERATQIALTPGLAEGAGSQALWKAHMVQAVAEIGGLALAWLERIEGEGE